MRWLNWIKDHVGQWFVRIPKYFKSIITAPLSIFSRRFSGESSQEEYQSNKNTREMNSSEVTLINPEELVEKLVRHLPEQLSSQEKKAEIQDLKNTIERLQQDTSNESKSAALRELSENEITKAVDILKKQTQSQITSPKQPTKQPSKDVSIDWIDIGNISLLLSPHKALSSFRKAVKMDSLSTEAWHRLGRTSYWVGNFNEARKAYEQILTLEDEDKSLQAIGYGNLGTIYKKSGELDKAEESYLKSIEINETLGQQEEVAFANGNLGTIYYTRGEYDKAEEFYLKALEINETLDRQEGMAIQYCNLGIIHKKRGELDTAEEYFLKSLEISEALEQKSGIASSYGNLGNIYKIRGKLDKAEEFHLKSLEINNSLNQKRGMASDYGNLGNIYKIKGNLDKACNYWKKSLELFSKMKAKEEVNLTKQLIADNCKTDK